MLRFMVNSTSGGGKAKKWLPALRRKAAELGAELHVTRRLRRVWHRRWHRRWPGERSLQHNANELILRDLTDSARTSAMQERRKHVGVVLLLAWLFLSVAAHAESRIWTSSKGTRIDATLIKHAHGWVQLKTSEGKSIRIRANSLAIADREYLKSLVPPEATLSAAREIKNIDDILEPIRAKYKLPALAALAILDNQITAIGAVGRRKHGGNKSITVNDRFHIGSNTKSMTATLVAMFVEKGKISWDTTIADVFPELKKSMHADYQAVTIEELLAHRGGTPGNIPSPLMMKMWESAHKTNQRKPRLSLIKSLLREPPEAPPGTRHIYSNAGYIIAGAMLEKIANQSWEALMTKMLFQPLGMKSAGFGAPAAKKTELHPWGHTLDQGDIEPVDPTKLGADNPPALGPAGTVHCSLGDLAKYLIFHNRGVKGKETLLSKESFVKLHTAIPGQEYALGWGVFERSWAEGMALTHAGSNTMFFMIFWLAPNRDFAVIVATNVTGEGASLATDEVAGALVDMFL